MLEQDSSRQEHVPALIQMIWVAGHLLVRQCQQLILQRHIKFLRDHELEQGTGNQAAVK